MMRGIAPRARRAKASAAANDGFSLLEVLIALTLIALVAALVGPRLLGQLDRSKVTAARVQIRALMSALETMRLDVGRYPTAEEGLATLVQAPDGIDEGGEGWHGPYLNAGLPDDPWGNPYLYEPPGDPEGQPRIGSLGADGREGGTGISADIVSGTAQ